MLSDITTASDPPYGDTGPRSENGKIIPRHLIVFHTPEENIIHLTVEYTVSIAAIIAEIEKYLGYAVTLHQTDKKNKTRKLNPNEIAEDGMNFGYSVDVKRLVTVPVDPNNKGRRTLHEIRKVLRAVAPPVEETKKAKSTDEGGRSTAPVVKRRRPPPEWAPRGVPGGHFLAQLPRKRDEDGNLLPTEYQDVYWHQGM
jgi:hypothetical protein